MRTWAVLSLATALTGLVCATTGTAHAAGLLRPVNTTDAAPQIVEHAVKVVIDNGFARTEVRQTFHNANANAIDAVYEFPVPPDAALSEMKIESGDHVLHGEVVARDKAQQVYDAQAALGAQVGLAKQNGYQNFQFSVANIPAAGDASLSFVYYEPVSIDTSVGRFLYPLENGGTDETNFWGASNESANVAKFSFDLELKSAVPVLDVRVPQVPNATVQNLGDGHLTLHFDVAPSALTSDVVVYYKLQPDLPGSVQLVPYRAAGGKPGTFMMLVTPGLDLPAIEHGTDYVYVLDFSGSMESKLATLKQAVIDALASLGPEDRFRLVGFADNAFDITPGLQNVTAANLATASAALKASGVQGGTNLYNGLSAGLKDHDPERVTTVFLVTDGVANEGIVSAPDFVAMQRECDLRIHGFLMGNSANWPLMEVITESSGGFYAPISNRDDLIGQVQQAKNKLTHESLHDARLELSGVQVTDTTDFDIGKVYRGQQLVVFGRYSAGGVADVQLHSRISNQDKTYSARVTFPDVAEDSPELERLWALDSIHAIQKQALLGLIPQTEANLRVQKLGVDYQLVTSETSMLVLDDQGFADQGIARNNQARSDAEHAAQGNGSNSAGTSVPVSTGSGTPATPSTGSGVPNTGASSPSTGSGSRSSDSSTSFGGALDPSTLVLLLGSLLTLGMSRRRRGASEAA
ncbi:MAG TPA: VIT and VWA domain-containing protein [Polyangiaceae bacterium]|nr:VIT and VWA domain-containing protein [Polyangiaceae bacterium]